MQKKIDVEINKLKYYEQSCILALYEFETNQPHWFLDKNDKQKIISLLERVFVSEIEFLNDSPVDYFDLYEDK